MIVEVLGEAAYFLITVASYSRQTPLPCKAWSRADAGLKPGPDTAVLVGS